MGKFNYREYLADNYLLKESLGEVRKPSRPATKSDLKGFATKSTTLNREKRAEKGNWKGSVGKYVEDHRAEIDAAAQRGHGELRAYMRSTMMPALGPEAQEYLEQLLTGYADDRKLHQALYNILLKGQGLGLHEDQDGNEGGGSFSRESNQDKVAIVLSYTTKVRPTLNIAGHTLDLSDYEGWDEMDPTGGIVIDGTPLSEYTDDKALQQIVSGIMSLPDFESESFREDYCTEVR